MRSRKDVLRAPLAPDQQGLMLLSPQERVALQDLTSMKENEDIGKKKIHTKG